MRISDWSSDVCSSDLRWNFGTGVAASIGGSIRSLSRQTGNFDPAYRAVYGHFPPVEAYDVVDPRAGLDFGRYVLNAHVNNPTLASATHPTMSLPGIPRVPRNVCRCLRTGLVAPR